jgi:hypothetical protein
MTVYYVHAPPSSDSGGPLAFVLMIGTYVRMQRMEHSCRSLVLALPC